ncbi:hypothetical protein ZWY2020_038460 [Hordeum vulgare]|nr:hypothetical protein ZWY2020_038460 [Hordeum vulgare]
MPCLAHHHHPRLPATNHCKSLSCLIRETYEHCHVPCLSIPGAGWSSDDDSDDDDDAALDTKQEAAAEEGVEEQRTRWLCRAPSWSFTLLDPRSVLEKVSSPEKFVVVEGEKEEAEAGSEAGDVESEAFFSVKSFFTSSTSRAATVASLTDMGPPATWEGFRDCEGWPFGLCRRPAVPPLPSTPADSWKWRKRSNLAASPRPAYTYKTTTT